MNNLNIVASDDFSASPASARGMKAVNLTRAKTCSVMGNVVYAERNGKKLRLQIVKPTQQDPAEKLPLIVFVQGSAWHKQNKYTNIPQLSRFALRGYVVAFVEYRESDIAPFPAQAQDCKTAIRFMKAHVDDYGVDAENVFLWGDSSGGHTVMMAGITGDSAPDTADYGEFSCKVNAIVNYYGPVDLAKMCEQPSTMNHGLPDSPEGYLIGKLSVLEHPDKVRAANPVAYIFADKECPPVLTMHGDTDRLVPFEQSVIIHKALIAAGKYSEYYKLLGADHGTGEFWSEGAYDIVEAFIRKFRNDL